MQKFSVNICNQVKKIKYSVYEIGGVMIAMKNFQGTKAKMSNCKTFSHVDKKQYTVEPS